MLQLMDVLAPNQCRDRHFNLPWVDDATSYRDTGQSPDIFGTKSDVIPSLGNGPSNRNRGVLKGRLIACGKALDAFCLCIPLRFILVAISCSKRGRHEPGDDAGCTRISQPPWPLALMAIPRR